MTISAYRTVKWTPPQRGFTLQKVLQWPDRYDADQTDFTLDMTLWLGDAGDTIASVDAPVATPSDLVVTTPQIYGGLVTVTLLRGSAALYTVGFVIRSTMSRVVEAVITIRTVAGGVPLDPSLRFDDPNNSFMLAVL